MLLGLCKSFHFLLNNKFICTVGHTVGLHHYHHFIMITISSIYDPDMQDNVAGVELAATAKQLH